MTQAQAPGCVWVMAAGLAGDVLMGAWVEGVRQVVWGARPAVTCCHLPYKLIYSNAGIGRRLPGEGLP